MLAYAHILKHEGYSTIFYKDYEVWLNKASLNNLIWRHNQKATGTTSILYQFENKTPDINRFYFLFSALKNIP